MESTIPKYFLDIASTKTTMTAIIIINTTVTAKRVIVGFAAGRIVTGVESSEVGSVTSSVETPVETPVETVG